MVNPGERIRLITLFEEFIRGEKLIDAVRKAGIDHRIHPTTAGLLMFGTYQRIMREFPDFLLDYYEVLDPTMRWTDRFASHSGDWSGNVYDFYTKVYMRIATDLKKPFKLDGIYRKDDTPIHIAVREALANCLVNADYFLPASVVVKKYPDRLVFINPGSIRTGKKQMLSGGISQPRNRVLLNMLNYIGIGERAGSGVPNIYSIWEEENLEEPAVEELSGREGTVRTEVTLPLVQKHNNGNQVVSDLGGYGNDQAENQAVSEKQPEKQPENKKAYEIETRANAVLEIITADPNASRGEIARKLGLTETQVRTALDLLKKRSLISHAGSARGGSWIVNN